MAIDLRSYAVELGREILHLEAVLAAKKEEMRKLVETVGPVGVDDVEFHFVKSTSWDYVTLEPLVRAIQAKGLAPIEFLSFGSTEAKKLMKATGWTENDLINLGLKKKESQRFTHTKKKK